MFGVSKQRAPSDRRRASGGLKPAVDGLEQRLLLYSTLGGQWAFGSRITYSIAPDGTSVGGVPSEMAQAMASRGIPESQWKHELRRAAAVWQSVANINLVEVPDSGDPLGISGNQQNDPRFGDIRITARPQPLWSLAYASPPPPILGGTSAGDVVFNSSTAWNVGIRYDLQTVAIHEIGHSLGVGHSEFSDSVMFDTYNGVKQMLTGDDVNGIRSLYGPRQHDWVDRFHNNKDPWNAVNVSGLIDSNRRVTLANLDLTSNQDDDWFYVQAPSNASGTMTITMQSKDLSSLSPRLQVYNSAIQLVGWTMAPNAATTYGATISMTFTGVAPGTGVYIWAMGWNWVNSGVNGIGAYALQADFSGAAAPSAIVSPPNTTVAEQPSQGGGPFYQTAEMGRSVGPWYHVTAPPAPKLTPASRFDAGLARWQSLPNAPMSTGTVAFVTPTRAELARLSGAIHRAGLQATSWFVQAVDASLDQVGTTTTDRPGPAPRRDRRLEEILAEFLA